MVNLHSLTTRHIPRASLAPIPTGYQPDGYPKCVFSGFIPRASRERDEKLRIGRRANPSGGPLRGPLEGTPFAVTPFRQARARGPEAPPPLMTWILYYLVLCPYCNGNALRVRRGSFNIWSNRKTLKH